MLQSRVVIVGAGVAGLSTAYHLASRRYGEVIVLDKGAIGDGSSSRAAGIITGLLWDETGVAARKKSLELFGELSKELRGYTFQNVGCLNLFDQQSWSEREALLPLYERLGAPYEVMSAELIHRRWPALTPDENMIGLFDPIGGYSEPDEFIPALVRKCVALGVRIRERQTVTGFLIRNNRACGVITSHETIEADAVVCTIDAWTLQCLNELGVWLPYKNFVHQRYVSNPLPAALAIPAVNANPLFGYIRPALGNRVLVGVETAEREEYPVRSTNFEMSSIAGPSASTVTTIYENLTTLMSLLGTLRRESEQIGLINFSIDGSPILGPVSAWPGLYVGLAFHSGGFAYSPVAGLLLAEFVEGIRTTIDVTAFSPDRFDARDTDVYLSSTVVQSQAVRRRH